MERASLPGSVDGLDTENDLRVRTMLDTDIKCTDRSLDCVKAEKDQDKVSRSLEMASLERAIGLDAGEQRSERVTFNIGGVCFVTSLDTLHGTPGTKFALIARHYKINPSGVKEYYFDRDPKYFGCVLEYLRTGELHLPADLCSERLRDELDFWNISNPSPSQCCFDSFSKYRDEEALIRKLLTEFETYALEFDDLTTQTTCLSAETRGKLRIFLSQPSSSKGAMIYFVVYMTILLVSAMLPALGTWDIVRDFVLNGENQPYMNTTETVGIVKLPKKPVVFDFVHLGSYIFFTVDFVLVLLVMGTWRNILASFKQPIHGLNIVWLMCGFTHVTLSFLGQGTSLAYTITQIAANVIRATKLIRLCAISRKLLVIYLTLRACVRDFGIMMVILIVSLLTFGPIIYYAEMGEESNKFPNMFIGYWWTVVTMTTVGYGDVHPTGVVGYLIGVVCICSGMIVTSLPISIISERYQVYSRFAENYERHKRHFAAAYDKCIDNGHIRVGRDDMKTVRY